MRIIRPNGGGSGGGSLTIQDEGVTLCSDVTTINYVGTDVLADCVAPGVVNVYIPTPEFDSHWNTSDGANGNQSVSESISRRNVHISDPNSQGNPFNTAGWEDQVHEATLADTVTFTTPGTTTGFGGDSVAVITVYDADGTTVLETHTTAALVGNGNYGAGNIDVTITGYTTDGPRFKAHMSISVDIESIVTGHGLLSGRCHVVATHITDSTTDNGNSYTYVQPDVFWDDNSTTPDITGTITMGETPGHVQSKHLSGLEYYILGSQFTVGVHDIDDLNKDTSRVDGNLHIVGSNFGLPTLDESPHGAGAANFSNWTNLYSNVDADYDWSAWMITAVNYRYVGANASISARPLDPWNGGITRFSPQQAVLVDTWGIRSTDLEEYFDDEARRQDSTFNSGSFTGNWVSTASLSAGEAIVFNSQIMHPGATTLFSTTDVVNTDWTSYEPNEGGANPDYTPLASQSEVRYYRTFRDSLVNGGPLSGLSRSSGRIVFSGTFITDAATDLQNEDIQIFIYKVSGMGNTGAPPGNTTPLLLHSDFYNFATFDDGVTDGHCRQATSSGNSIDFTFGGYNMEDGIYVEVRILDDFIKIDSMVLSFS